MTAGTKKVVNRDGVGRIVSAHPAEGERYYLRVILNHVTGATSFEDLRTVDGVVLPTFREAAERRGLIESDNTLDECLTEATMFQMPSSLRRLFATILVFCEPSDVRRLWQKHLDTMSEDYQRNNQSKFAVEQLVLIDIRNILESMGKDIKSFPLPKIDKMYDNTNGIAREILEEARIKPTIDDMSLSESLNQEQRAAYNEIMTAIDNGQGGVFFVDGPGGTGKTYLYKALLATVRNQEKIAVATATSGVAASIMPGGRTAHSRFKIPLSIDNGAYCSFMKQSGTAKLLKTASLIIWDEASMTKRQAIEALDNSMRDIMERPELPSYLWDSMRHLKLVENMRAKSDPWFAEYLLRIGGGTEAMNDDGDVHLPDEICLLYTGEDSDLDTLIDCIFPRLNENMEDTNYITSRAILATRNDWVDIINMKMIQRFQGDEMVYHSFDTAVDDPHNYYPSEFLNSLSPNGLPPHVLKLKIGCPVILLRNIDPANGLCNGTRLVVRGFQRNIIDAEIVLGQHAGRRIFLPRIPLCPSDDEMFPFQFKRKQFPIRLSFVMTINKAQGQTIPNVGNAAYLILRGMKTLHLRVQCQNNTALRMAQFLEEHPKIARVYYPGLTSHPEHHIAKSQMTGFGGVVSFEVDGDFDATRKFIDSVKIPYHAPSFGGCESIIDQPAIMSYWDSKEQRDIYGIKDNLIRFSIGVEDFEDLKNDVVQALDKI
ncbi:hypothetical protein ACP4OV_019095 [Aristida adscensionis]